MVEKYHFDLSLHLGKTCKPHTLKESTHKFLLTLLICHSYATA